MKDGKNSGAAGLSRRHGWKSADSHDIQATKSINKLGEDNGADRGRLLELQPQRLSRKPSTQAFSAPRGMVWVQSLFNSTNLSDQRANPKRRYHERTSSSGSCSSIHEEELYCRAHKWSILALRVRRVQPGILTNLLSPGGR